ncbi:MAG: hypothetical protein WCE75_02160 [Terracidiphilus sp.]
MAGIVATIDVVGRQGLMARRIAEKRAGCVLAPKGNRGLLVEQVRDSFLLQDSGAAVENVDCGHGRVEQRPCAVIAGMSMIDNAAEWASLKGLVRIESERYHKAMGKSERETRRVTHARLWGGQGRAPADLAAY